MRIVREQCVNLDEFEFGDFWDPKVSLFKSLSPGSLPIDGSVDRSLRFVSLLRELANRVEIDRTRRHAEFCNAPLRSLLGSAASPQWPNLRPPRTEQNFVRQFVHAEAGAGFPRA